MSTNNTAIIKTKKWIKEWVIGLNLCPFAREPFDKDRIRYVFDNNRDPYESLALLLHEVEQLRRSKHETSLIVYPNTDPFLSFDAFMDYCAAATDLLLSQGLEKDIQLAYFHPLFVFDGAPIDDPANTVNQSPHPVLHLLRVKDVEEAVHKHPDTTSISFANMKKLREMEKEKKTKA